MIQKADVSLFFLILTVAFSYPHDSCGGDSPLIDVKTLAPGIRVEMRYATTNNFTKKILYPKADQCLLCEPAAQRLARVQKNLEKKGLGLKIWDCYRPLSIQQKLWDVVPDANYVANPKTGSKHNRGASVDLTLVDKNGQELQMPTDFDEFSQKAHRATMDLPEAAIKNRQILETAMQAEGFIGIPKEWWHFDDPDWIKYSLRDEPIGDAALMKDQKNAALSFSLPTSITQLAVVRANEWRSTTGTLVLYEKKSSSWTQVSEAWPINLGMKGMMWGLGIQPIEALASQKTESDLTTPAGIFKIGQAYGQVVQPENLNWPFQTIDSTWRCVDDAKSKYYNVVLAETPAVKKDWSSAEIMDRKDHIYKYVINIEQNFPYVKAGCGSCIFFHVRRAEKSATEGCVSMEENRIVDLLQWLDPKKNPHVVILPEAVYSALKSSWQLP